MSNLRRLGSALPVPQGAVSDPYNQRRVPSPRAAGIAYPGAIEPAQKTGAQRDLATQVAAPSQTERYPIIVGRNLTLETVSSRFRLSLTGYRQLYVDLLNELIERDPHAFAIISKRTLAVANSKFHAVPPKLPSTAPEEMKKRAAQIAEEYDADIQRIPRLKQHLASLAWADYYALQGAEIIWDHDTATGRWRPADLVMLHSRRLSYPDPWRWDLYVWDQGAVIGSPMGDVRLPPGIFGWRVADYPGKFIVHAPQLRGDYPTREGLGRELAYWMVLKHIGARAAPQYLERFAEPPTDLTYATGAEEGMHRKASKEDIADAKAAASAGTLRAWAHPDSIKWELKAPDGAGGRAKVTFGEWINLCNNEMSKAVLGGTLGTDVGSTGGNRALGGVQRKDTLALFQYSAASLCDSWDEGMTRTWGMLNYPNDEQLWPHMEAQVEDDPDPMDLIERAVAAASAGIPVDADAMGEMTGLPLIAKDDKEGRVMRPVKADVPSATPQAPETGANNAEAAQAQADADAQAAADLAAQGATPTTAESDNEDETEGAPPAANPAKKTPAKKPAPKKAKP